MTEKEARETNWCFACGKDNPMGLHLHMEQGSDGNWAYFTPRRQHQSYDDRMHGGLVSTLLDEVMGDYIFKLTGRPAYTAKIEVRFRQAVRIGERIKISGHLEKQRGRLYEMTGVITKDDGTVVAEGQAKMMSAK